MKCKNTFNDTKKCIFRSKISLNLYFYAGIAILWHDEVKHHKVLIKFPNHHADVLSLSIHVEFLENLINVFWPVFQ